MTPETTLAAELLKLVPVIVGGLITILASGIALAGGLIVQKRTADKVASQERDKLIREKAETFISHLLGDAKWLERCVSAVTKFEDVPPTTSDSEHAAAIQGIYFPETATQWIEVVKTRLVVYTWALSHRPAQVVDAEKWSQNYDKTQLGKVYAPYREALENLIREVTKTVRRRLALDRP